MKICDDKLFLFELAFLMISKIEINVCNPRDSCLSLLILNDFLKSFYQFLLFLTFHHHFLKQK